MAFDLDLELDVDTLRCNLLASSNEAHRLADEIVFLVESGGTRAELERVIANRRQVRNDMRRLQSLIRVEEGNR